MTIAIIDDFEPDRLRIAAYTKRFFVERTASEPRFFFYSEGEAFLTELFPEFFNLVLLDCCLKGMDGLETAKELRKTDKKTALIFVSYSRDFAIEGYSVDACGYLTKPFTYDTLSRVFDAAIHRMPHIREAIVVFDGQTDQKIFVDDIVYCDVVGHYSQLHLCNHQTIRIRMPFSTLSAIIRPFSRFLECYRGCIINMEHIKKSEELNFLMDTGERVPFRKKGQRTLLRKYSEYLFDKIRAGEPQW